MNLLNEALRYAARGWYVVPDHSVTPGGFCTCRDPLCKGQGKHQRMEREAPGSELRGTGSRDPRQITAWWQMWPDSNIAIVCGKGSNLVAIDIDPRNDGFNSWARLLRMHRDPGPTLTSITGGAGRHYLFTHPQNEIVRNRIGLCPGIDVKADGGLIVAPPSNHKSGACYRWENFNEQPAPLPRWLLHMIQLQKGTGTNRKTPVRRFQRTH